MHLLHLISLLFLIALAACESGQQQSFGFVKDAESVQAIEVSKSAEDQTIFLQRSENAWIIPNQRNFLIDQKKVATLLAHLQTLRAVSVFRMEKDNLSIYGLAPAVLRVAFSTKEQEQERTILIGSYSEFAQKRYCMDTASQLIGLCPEQIYTLLSRPEEYYINPQLFAFSPAAMCSIVVDAVEESFQLIKEREHWRIQSEHGRFFASENAVHSLLESINQFASKKAIDETKGADFPISILVKDCKNHQTNILLSDLRKDAFDVQQKAILVQVAAKTFEVQRSQAPVLPLRTEYFRVQEPFIFKIDAVQEVTFVGKLLEEQRVFTRDGYDWLLNGKRADTPFVRDLLKKLRAISAERYLTLEEMQAFTKRHEADLRIIMKNRDTELLLSASIWKMEEGNEYIAQNDAFLEPFAIKKEVVDMLIPRQEVLLPVVGQEVEERPGQE